MAFIINDKCHRRIYQILLYILLVKKYGNPPTEEDYFWGFEWWDYCEECGKEKFCKDLVCHFETNKLVCIDCDD